MTMTTETTTSSVWVSLQIVQIISTYNNDDKEQDSWRKIDHIYFDAYIHLTRAQPRGYVSWKDAIRTILYI